MIRLGFLQFWLYATLISLRLSVFRSMIEHSESKCPTRSQPGQCSSTSRSLCFRTLIAISGLHASSSLRTHLWLASFLIGLSNTVLGKICSLLLFFN